MKLCSPSATSRLDVIRPPILGNCRPFYPVSSIPTHTGGLCTSLILPHTEAPAPGRFTQPLPPLSTRGREGPRPCGPTAPPPIGKFETLVHLLIWVYICPPPPPPEIIGIILLPRSQPLPRSTHRFLFQLPSSEGSRVEPYLCSRAAQRAGPSVPCGLSPPGA